MATTKMREKAGKKSRRKGTLPGGASPSDMKKIMDRSLLLQAQRGYGKSRSMKQAWSEFKAGTL